MEVGLEAFVNEEENIYEVLAGLEGTIGTYMQTHHSEVLKTSNVSKPQAQPQPQEQLERIKQPFGDLANLLSFEVQGGLCIIRARQYLGSENFAKIASVVRAAGGEYVSQGKNSHFKVPLPSQK
jgi:hypothetical protein